MMLVKCTSYPLPISILLDTIAVYHIIFNSKMLNPKVGKHFSPSDKLS